MREYVICYTYIDETTEIVTADSEEEAIDLLCDNKDVVWVKEVLKETRIDLGKNSSVHNLVGKEIGISAREYFNLDVLDNDTGSVEVLIPEEIHSISALFFIGMFGKSIKKLGEEGFLKKYHFKANDIIMKEVLHGITRCNE